MCAIAAPHRKQAFVACDELVDTVKQRVPIWKHQVFDDGRAQDLALDTVGPGAHLR